MKSNSSLSPASFRFKHQLTVRRSEVDAKGVVYNANYLMYFDTAVMDYWRALGLPYADTLMRSQSEVLVRKAALEYYAPAHFGDRLHVGIRLLGIGHSSLTLQGAIWREGRLLNLAEIVSVFVGASDRKPQAVSACLAQVFKRHEAGEGVTSLCVGSWEAWGKHARSLRHAVFVQEQGVPEHEEWDDADAQAVHAVLYNGMAQAIATGRLLKSESGLGRIGRMAVHAGVRGFGHGALVLDGLIEAARSRGDQRIEIHAQQSALAFYRRRGFVAVGQPFDEVGIPHQAMILTL